MTTPRSLPLALCIPFAATALASDVPPHAAGLTGEDVTIVSTESFLTAHPDQLYRLKAQGALHEGDAVAARRHFTLASRYADKLSQAMLAQMWWDGKGGETDRALAYVWMDLAAERRTPLFLAERERFWNALDTAQRQRALAIGKAIFDEYADDVAQPRLEREMRKAQLATVGSRIAHRSGKMDVCIGTSWITMDHQFVCNERISAHRYYQARFWEPAQYWAWQEQVLRVTTGLPDVEVGQPSTVTP